MAGALAAPATSRSRAYPMLAALVATVVALAAPAAPSATAAPTLPLHGIVAPGQSLAGVRLGDTPATVRARWGSSFAVCRVCPRRTWLYTYRPGNPVGAAVAFRNGRVVAAFTLGAPRGWRTRQGVVVGGFSDRVQAVYGRLPWHRCIGYGALSLRRGAVVTSFYTSGEYVYGFALTRPGDAVCQ